MDRSEWDENDDYPVAPVPTHERGWRHPSEMGEQAWVKTEPPLAIGRGLTAATGAVGGLLALAVLWTMLPTHAGRGAGVSALSSVPTFSLDPSDQFVVAAPPPSSTAAPATTIAAAPTTGAAITAAPSTGRQGQVDSTVAHVHPMPTYQVSARTKLDRAAVAVAVHDGSLVITTARAVDADNTVDLVLPDGAIEHARVLLVDRHSGFAVLAPEAAARVTSFAVATSVTPGEVLTFYGEPSTQVTVASDGSIPAGWAEDPSVLEGTPLVNQHGELVALCSHDASGPQLVRLAVLDELQRTLAGHDTSKVWLGIVLNDAPSGAVTVAAVDPAGPAATAGVLAGDTITAIDNVALDASITLAAALAGFKPGDTVQLTVVRAGTTTTIPVVLGAAPSM